MCGIAGVIDYSETLDISAVVSRMTSAIAHRGPNGHGKIIQRNVGLGHRRLSIIDLEGGRQPMSTPDGKVHLTYNGEVYNFRELRKDLEAKGYKFQTSSDTEVVLHAYEAWGKKCVERFEGMFAFGVADFRKCEVFLARDPFGIKPLLYRSDNKSFAFASEFQALMQLPDWSGEIDLSAIDLYLRYQYIPAPHTAFRKVFKLPAGHRMTVRMGEPYQKIEKYWEPDFSNKKRKFNGHELVEVLDRVLEDSVKRHLVADVPFGALLSGGVDSSLIVAYMAELVTQPLKTFSIGFDEHCVNELEHARVIAEKYGTDHHEEIITFDAIEALPEIVRHHGEPFGDQSSIPTWAVCRLARSHVPMVLSGDGGDELMAGYSTYGHWISSRMRNEVAAEKKSLRSRVRPLAKLVRPWRYKKQSGAVSEAREWFNCTARFKDDQRESLWHPELRFVADSHGHEYSYAFNDTNRSTGVNRPQFSDLQTWLPENILCKVDIASMRYGLEVRPPILDRRVFALASAIPEQALYTRSSDLSVYIGKLPLKNLLAQKISEEFAFRKKQGFSLPLESWLSKNMQNRQHVRDRLLAKDSGVADWFSRQSIENTIASGTPENVWLLMVIQEWCQQNKAHGPLKRQVDASSNDRSPLSAAPEIA